MLNLKKWFLLGLVSLITIGLVSCGSSKQLLILNWGEYLNPEVIERFEAETGYQVIEDITDSNELFYAKVKSGTTAYDLVVPSDYMVEKMVEKKLLQTIDLEKLNNYNPITNPFMEGAKGIQSLMFAGNENYAVPYFWGTFGLMYNKQVNGLEAAVKQLGWQAFFDPDSRPKGTRVGMYNVSRYTYAASQFYQHNNPNDVTDASLDQAYQLLLNANFTEWGFDTLKKGVLAGNLDLAFVYTGDFLDMLYTRLDAGDTLEQITFDIYIPDETIAFMDFLVIPQNARHVDIAHQFIDFMLRPDIAYLNAQVVGYATPLQLSYNKIIRHVNDDDAWLSNWAYANKTYYPLPNETDIVKFKGTPLKNIDQAWLDKITLMVNNVKANSRK